MENKDKNKEDYARKKRDLLKKLNYKLPSQSESVKNIIVECVLGKEENYKIPVKEKHSGKPSLQTMRTAHGYFTDPNKVREYKRIFDCSVNDMTNGVDTFADLYRRLNE